MSALFAGTEVIAICARIGETSTRMVESMTTIDEQQPPVCRCGRAVRYLNPVSDEAKCVGCGYVEELCRCLGIGGVVNAPYILGEGRAGCVIEID